MGLIEDELEEVGKLCQRVVEGSKLVACVQTMVRVEIRRTRFKHVVACIQFPKDYPHFPLLLELKSKTLSDKLLDGLTQVCEQEAKKIIGKPQVITVLKFIRNFLDENPLSCCYDEIAAIKSTLSNCDELKLKQKISSIVLRIVQDNYYFRTKVFVPDDYPTQAVSLEDIETNFPHLFQRFFVGNAKEIARQCVQPPAKKQQAAKVFAPKESLQPVVSFLVSAVKQLPCETCQLCKHQCLPRDPQVGIPQELCQAALCFVQLIFFGDVETDESADQHVERVYCSHLFHLHCLVTYMKTPPFQGGKKCPTCGQRIYHDKWRVSEQLAEDRWAHQQARDRELQEVSEFFH